MIETIEIKDMSIEHIEEFGRMLAAMVAEAPRNFTITPEAAVEYGSNEAFMAGMEKAILENRVGRFVASDGSGSLLGAVTTSRKEDSLRIGNMYVRPDARTLGVGSLLLAACEDRAVSDSYTHTSLEVGSGNAEAILFYKRYGYQSLSPRLINNWDMHPGVFGEVFAKKF